MGFRIWNHPLCSRWWELAGSGALHPSNPWKNISNENSCVRFVRSLMCIGWNWICREESIQLFSSLFDTIIVLFTPQGIFYTNRGAQWKERKETKSCKTFLAFSCDATFLKVVLIARRTKIGMNASTSKWLVPVLEIKPKDGEKSVSAEFSRLLSFDR